jgi:hypothetical protein
MGFPPFKTRFVRQIILREKKTGEQSQRDVSPMNGFGKTLTLVRHLPTGTNLSSYDGFSGVDPILLYTWSNDY